MEHHIRLRRCFLTRTNRRQQRSSRLTTYAPLSRGQCRNRRAQQRIPRLFINSDLFGGSCTINFDLGLMRKAAAGTARSTWWTWLDLKNGGLNVSANGKSWRRRPLFVSLLRRSVEQQRRRSTPITGCSTPRNHHGPQASKSSSRTGRFSRIREPSSSS